MISVRLKPAASRCRVKHSTTEPLRSLDYITVTDDCIIVKTTHFGDFVKKGSNFMVLHAKVK